jgi:hypothetical protein
MPWQRKGPPERVANARAETRHRLDGLIRRDRARKWLLALAGAAAVLGLGYAIVFQSPPTVREVEAVVRLAAFNIDDTGQRYISIDAQLDNGKLVRAGSQLGIPPKQGARIVLTESVGLLGYHVYEWYGRTAD